MFTSQNHGERFLELCTFYRSSYVPCLVAGDLGKGSKLTPGLNSHALSYQAPGIFQVVIEPKELFELTGVFRS